MEERPGRVMKGRIGEKQADLTPPRVIGKNRKCVECGARMSQYNPADKCYSHDDPRDARVLTRHSTRKS